MNRLIMAAVAAAGIFAASAAEEEETVQNWRLTVGGLARGSMKAQIGDLGSKWCESCSLVDDCQPGSKKRSARAWLDRQLEGVSA